MEPGSTAAADRAAHQRLLMLGAHLKLADTLSSGSSHYYHRRRHSGHTSTADSEAQTRTAAAVSAAKQTGLAEPRDVSDRSAFLTMPYVQLSTASADPDGKEQLTVMWHTLASDDTVGGWLVRWEGDRTDRLRRSTGKLRPRSTLVELPGCVPHLVWRCEISGLQPGRPTYYEVWRGVGGIPHGAEEQAASTQQAAGAMNADGSPDGERVFAATAHARKHKGQPYRFAVAGDIGAGSPEQRVVAASLATLLPDFIVVPGDFMYSHGRVAEYWSSDFWGIYSADEPDPSVGGPLLRTVPMFGGLGQHDSEGTHGTIGARLPSAPQGRAAVGGGGNEAEGVRFHDGNAWYMYWNFPLNGPDASVLPAGPEADVWPMGGSAAEQAATLNACGERWPRMSNYSLSYGNSFWIVLNTWPPSDWGASSPLRAWLEHTLASGEAQAATWRFVVCYLPPFNAGTAYPDTQKMRVVADLFEAGGVDIVFSSYIHVYQRSKPLRFRPAHTQQQARSGSGPVRDYGHEISGEILTDDTFDGRARTVADGVIYIVSGCGGQGLHDGDPSQTDAPTTWAGDFTVAFNGSSHGYSELAVDGGKLEFWQRDSRGDEIDRMTLTKTDVADKPR